MKSETKISTNNLNLVSDKTDEIDDVGSNAPPPLSSSAYVDSGGAAKVDSESSSSVGGKKSSSTSKKDDIKTAQSTFVEYSLNNDLIMLNLEEAKPSKFTIFSSVKQDKIFFFNNREKINIPIAFDNITNQKIEVGLLDYDPVICVIPIEGLEINSTLITNVKKGIDPEDFYLKFSKNIVFTNSIKLELEKSFHLSIESAIEKYKELQTVLKIIKNEFLSTLFKSILLIYIFIGGCVTTPKILFEDPVDTKNKRISIQEKKTFSFEQAGVYFSNDFLGARLNNVIKKMIHLLYINSPRKSTY